MKFDIHVHREIYLECCPTNAMISLLCEEIEIWLDKFHVDILIIQYRLFLRRRVIYCLKNSSLKKKKL